MILSDLSRSEERDLFRRLRRLNIFGVPPFAYHNVGMVLGALNKWFSPNQSVAILHIASPEWTSECRTLKQPVIVVDFEQVRSIYRQFELSMLQKPALWHHHEYISRCAELLAGWGDLAGARSILEDLERVIKRVKNPEPVVREPRNLRPVRANVDETIQRIIHAFVLGHELGHLAIKVGGTVPLISAQERAEAFYNANDAEASLHGGNARFVAFVRPAFDIVLDAEGKYWGEAARSLYMRGQQETLVKYQLDELTCDTAALAAMSAVAENRGTRKETMLNLVVECIRASTRLLLITRTLQRTPREIGRASIRFEETHAKVRIRYLLDLIENASQGERSAVDLIGKYWIGTNSKAVERLKSVYSLNSIADMDGVLARGAFVLGIGTPMPSAEAIKQDLDAADNFLFKSHIAMKYMPFQFPKEFYDIENLRHDPKIVQSIPGFASALRTAVAGLFAKQGDILANAEQQRKIIRSIRGVRLV